MTLNKKPLFFIQNLLVLTAFLIATGCANIQRPMGGPRDKTPPKLLKATPLNPTRNFSAKQIQLDFDEYFKLNSEYTEITITPNMEKMPDFNVKSKSLIIKLKDTLAKNTTYVINFGKAIADVNEGNILKNFTYVFSTGPNIDSLSISGNVTNILTQAKEKDVTILLFPLRLDTLFGKKKPAIYTTTDSAGNYKLGNLHAGDYKIYALKESTVNKIYDNDAELIAFQKNTIHLTKDTADVRMNLFRQIPAKLRVTERRIEQDGKLFFLFNKSIPDPGVKILDPELDAQKIVDFGQNADTAQIYLPNMAFDSIKVSFLSGGKALDTLTLRKRKNETYKRNIQLRFNTTFDDHLKTGSDLTVTANYPIQNIDQSRIILIEDTVDAGEVKLIRNLKDPKVFTIKYPWKAGKRYGLSFNIGTFTDIYGDKNILLKKSFQLDKPENYSTLTLKVTLPDTGSYVVQLLNTETNTEIRSDVITKNGSILYKDYPTGKYGVRVIYDKNHNGKWDTGDMKTKKYPENIWYLKKNITLRANFEVEEELPVPKEVSP
ncbi:Ig-like domain-containing protein [Mucilaginibacter sp. HMF5004]|uniref:Ig-like domain-containing protein n=1 Tax=Mucilaginibacter rivuli TaxID=2857527 RepID=UPI001C5D7A9A|nr:Ig-like domain-containing protein [Mucilaginibacter rivuli]MBW4890414.1 Ig-like domain-containing protein [Mucilaginibacter rivuli]